MYLMHAIYILLMSDDGKLKAQDSDLNKKLEDVALMEGFFQRPRGHSLS